MSPKSAWEEKVSIHLAKNLNALRKTRGLTQEGLAKLAEVPRSTLTHIESGEGNPSLRNLCKLGAALQVNLEELLAEPRPKCKLLKADKIRVETRANQRIRFFKLLPDPIPGMTMDRIEIEPGAKMAGVPHIANTKEYLTCMQGEVLLHILGESYHLNQGDVLAFPGDQPHGYQNPGHGLSVCISVVVLAPANLR